MPRITDISLFQKPAQNTVSLRTRCSMETLPQTIGEGYGKLAQYFGQKGLLLSEVPFIAYHNMDMQDIDLELAFPVKESITDDGEFKPGIVPEGLYAECLYLGSYSGLEPIYTEVMKWIDDNGYQMSGAVYECYYNGPDRPEDQLLTKVSFSVSVK